MQIFLLVREIGDLGTKVALGMARALRAVAKDREGCGGRNTGDPMRQLSGCPTRLAVDTNDFGVEIGAGGIAERVFGRPPSPRGACAQ